MLNFRIDRRIMRALALYCREDGQFPFSVCRLSNLMVQFYLFILPAFDAYSNGWRSSQTQKYFFSIFMYILTKQGG